MSTLISRPIKRFFAFGCSFTNWCTATWADIIAYDLGVEYYNYGRPGAGNQYIFNMIMQADSLYNFDEDDLIIVEWTNVAREDKYKNQNWTTPGNIYTQQDYDMKYVEQWADFEGYLIRDLAVIKATSLFLKNKKLQHHILSMAPLFTVNSQWENIPVNSTHTINKISELYKPYIDEIHKSFFEILWNGSIRDKVNMETRLYGRLVDGHPSPAEHYTFLLKTFNHKFSKKISDTVAAYNSNVEHIMLNIDFAKTSLGPGFFDHLRFVKSQEIKQL